ncbi:serine hydrolase domain-containing protein [Nocardia mexicana]|uniref:D-alanyl-D-alanine carboxypeptidase n=1 Tax=Nocardia mexicana TaxID=279262 RepID=A0A370H3D2_9NOCA|nr:serine hydrolase domain-containing protein [Nocardia mexicana]RDI50164.1 D-alanyl-D-alanine carboxypeptidase [Nocardia mexicana]
MSITLTAQDKTTLRTAAYGAVSLLAAAGGKPHRIATDGTVALSSATGLVGHVLAEKTKDIDLKGKSVAALADQVLPALTAAMSLLEQDPAEAENFRTTVLVAVESARAHQDPSPTMAEMTRKITAALAPASSNSVAGPEYQELQQTIEEIVESGFAGMTLRVHDERGEWVGSAGVSKLGETAPPPIDGHVRIGSNTKTFTATLVLQLVAEGKIGLDVAVVDYLPEFEIDPRITVRMLLQHTSGIFNHTGEYFEGKVEGGTPFGEGTMVPGIAWQGKEWVENRFKTYQPEELVRLALSKPARFEPGTGWSYSNTNYVLARLLIEKVTGRPYAQEMQRLILGPLGLSGTVAPTTQSELPEPHAHAYYRYSDGGEEKTVDVTSSNPSWISSGGDMISTTRDLHTFISALAGGKLLPAELRAEMVTPYPTGIPNMDYGLGVFVLQTGDGTVISHNGGHGGHGALMYSTADGSKTLTGSLNYVDDADLSGAAAFQAAQQKMINTVFGGPAEAAPTN